MNDINVVKFIWFIGIIIISICFYFTIPILRRIKMGQSIRIDGPSRHQTKAGTPTMGGIIIIIGTMGLFFSFLIVNKINIFANEVFLLLISFLGYGIIGYYDDYLIVVKKSNKGISVKVKFIMQFVIALLIYLCFIKQGLLVDINVFGFVINIGFLYSLFILLYYVAVTNAVNITDGIDGLAGGLLLIAFGAFGVLANFKNSPYILYFSLAIIASLLAFFLYNFHPAQIFMGNTGSMALGGGLAAVALLLKMEFLLLVIGGIFVWETLTDIIQVLYYKKTRGKRFFLMAPFHHHLELKGWSEWKIDLVLWLFGLLLAFVGIYLGVRLF